MWVVVGGGGWRVYTVQGKGRNSLALFKNINQLYFLLCKFNIQIGQQHDTMSGLYFRFHDLDEVFSKISLESAGEDPLQDLEQAQSRPEPQVGAQKVEEIIEVEPDQGGPLGGDRLGEAHHKRGHVGLKRRVETLQ